jgi:hypothetical protein
MTKIVLSEDERKALLSEIMRELGARGGAKGGRWKGKSTEERRAAMMELVQKRQAKRPARQDSG